MAEASYCAAKEGNSETLHCCRHKLSALIDRGRFFFPNVHTDKYGTHKEPAYRGLRHSALDPLVAAERVLGGELGAHENPEAALIHARRVFVSRIQRVLAPELRNRQIASLVAASGGDVGPDATLGGLLPAKDEIPEGADSLLYQRASPAYRHIRPD